MRDLYSNMRYYTAFEPQDVVAGAQRTGFTIDRRGYNGVLFIFNIGQANAAAAWTAQAWQLQMEQAHTDSAIPDTWSAVLNSELIFSGISAGTTITSGVFLSAASYTGFCSGVVAVGYKGSARMLRVCFSDVNACSTISAGAVAILGFPADWPVNMPG